MATSLAAPQAAASNKPRIGLVAGWGRFPLEVATALARQGFEIACLGVGGHSDREALLRVCHDYHEVGVAQLGAALRFFRKRGISTATLAGKIFKVKLFEKHFAWKNLPDLRAIRVFWPHFVRRSKDRRDDTLLLAVVEAFAHDGIQIVPATELVPELLMKTGHLAGPALSRAQQQDIEFGWNLAKELGRLDVGQSVCVRGRAALAVEAIEGTDECIRRAGQLCPQGGFVVVKVAKPQQDMRFDVPTIGVGTVDRMHEAGAKVLAVEGGKTILVEAADVIERANRLGISIAAL